MPCEDNVLKRILNIFLSVWMAVLLVFGGAPKEFIHLFADHEDTHCTAHHVDGLVIEPEHHHCDFLQFSLASFINDVYIPVFRKAPVEHIIHNEPFSCQLFARAEPVHFLRGPPASV